MLGAMSFLSSNRSLTESSRPTLTRESSGNDTDLPTPTYEPLNFDSNGPPGNKFNTHGPSNVSNVAYSMDAALIRMSSQDSTIVTPVDGRPVFTRAHTSVEEAYGPPISAENSYFPPVPTRRNSEDLCLRRRLSTKELVSHFEGMTGTGQSTPTRTPVSSPLRQSFAPDETSLARPLSALKSPGHSPLRESFRNIVSLFGKKRKGSPVSNYYESPHMSGNLLQAPVPEQPSESIVTKSGPVLYLSRLSTGMLPVWAECTATLHLNHISLEWFSSHGNPSSMMINLTAHADVRSVPASRVDATERKLLPNTHEDYYVFEIVHEGLPPDRFATTSVADRSTWVSAIWDNLLQLLALENANSSLEASVSSRLLPALQLKSPSLIRPDHAIAESMDVDNRYASAASAYTGVPESCYSVLPTLPPNLNDYYDERKADDTRVSFSNYTPLEAIDDVVTERDRLSQTMEFCPSDMYAPSSSDQSETLVPSQQDLMSTRNSLQGISSYRSPTRASRASSLMVRDDRDESESIYSYYAHTTRMATTLSPIPDASPMPPQEHSASNGSSLFDENGLSASPSTLQGEVTAIEEEQDLELLKDTVNPLVSLIQDHAAQQYGQGSGISQQIAALQIDVLGMSEDLRTLIGEYRPGSSIRVALESLCRRMEDASCQKSLQGLHEKVDKLGSSVMYNVGAGKKRDASTPDQKILKSIEEAQQKLALQLSTIAERLGGNGGNGRLEPSTELQVHSKLDELLLSIKDLKNGQLSSTVDPAPEILTVQNIGATETAPENANIHDQMHTENLMSLHALPTQNASVKENSNTHTFPTSVAEKLTEIMALLKKDSEEQRMQAGQQADSIRYLNQLHTWLETFASTGGGQLQTIAQGVQKLCDGMKPSEDPAVVPTSIDKVELQLNLQSLNDATQKINEGNAAIQGTMAELLSKVKEIGERNAPSRESLGLDALVQMIDQQKLDHESMLKGIASNLSDEIRGERLRFVEAMKEATAINVQVHVEEFKNELTKEVMAMTVEVGRLHRERQALEQQIADLFAFFSKQRAEMQEAKDDEAKTQEAQKRASQLVRKAASSSRPLPVPGQLSSKR